MHFINSSNRNAFYCLKRIYGEMNDVFSIFMTCHFLQSIWQGDKEVFYLIHTFTLQFCCSSPTIKTHIISLQSVINNMYTSYGPV